MQNLTEIKESEFIGMNDKYPSHLLPPGVFQLVENALVADNKIAKRPGSDNIAASLGAFSILGVSAYEPTGGTKRIIAYRNGSSNAQLYSWAGSGAFSAIGSANLTIDAPMNFAQASNRLFGFNGTDVVDVNSSLTVTKNRAGIPLGKIGIWFHNYLFVANTTANPSRLAFSDLNDPITFTAANFIDINPDDGDEITGLAIINDELFIFKKYTIWTITGWSGSTFSATTIAGQNTNSKIYGYGCVSHQSIVNTGRDLFYLSFLGGIPYIRSFLQTTFAETIEQGIVSFDMEGTLDGVNKSQLSKCAGVYDGKYIYWALPNGASTTNNLVIVFDPEKRFKVGRTIYRSWVRWAGITPSQYAVSTISGRSKVYFGDATTGGFVFEQGTSTFDDNGTAVSMDVRTKDFMLSPSKKSKWKYIYLKYGTGFTGTLTVNTRAEKTVNFTLQKSISLAGTSPGLGPTGTFTLGTSVLGGADVAKQRVNLAEVTGSLFGIRFREITSSNCELFDYSVLGFKKGYRDS